jgi:F0F1-type ATP synthase assembly protein I
MSLPGGNTSLKRLRNRYRLVVMNEDTYNEVVTFKLTRLSVYIVLSTLFVILVGLTVALIAFTPLKLYIPGYGEAQKAKEYEVLKMKADSIEQNLIKKQEYIDNIEKVLKGNIVPRDTTVLKLKNIEKSSDWAAIKINELTDNNEGKKLLQRYAGLATQFLVSIGLGVFIGLKADKWFHLSFPLLVWLLPLLIIVGLLFNILKETSKKKWKKFITNPFQ